MDTKILQDLIEVTGKTRYKTVTLDISFRGIAASIYIEKNQSSSYG